ncbi:MAG TPA: TIGR03943 family protein [Arachnia sp.]|nr:TIGR03943 family protein [Arachnia sp.]HMT86418.1 TIGR03943 family protein [Arachnia sp.]
MSEIWSRYFGLALCGIGAVATLCLAATGRLELYIHPRYTTFAVAMAILGVIAVLLTPWLLHGTTEHGHDDDHPERGPAWRRLRAAGGVALVALAGVALLVVTPSTLSARRAAATDLTTAGAVSADNRPVLVGGDSTAFTVREWSAVLSGGATGAQLAAQRADVTGFVLTDPAGSDDVVFLARYLITCCIVDAQVVAIPVQAGEWSAGLSDGDWVRITGAFGDVPGAAPVTRLIPSDVVPIDAPADPYEF